MMMNTGKDSAILGIGNDIIEIERIRASISTHGQPFLDKLFTQKEQDYCGKYKDPIPHYAARFCAKESIVKALGTGFGKEIGWQDIEILNDERGKPTVYLSLKAKEHFENPILLISLSHSDLFATAIAIWSAYLK